MYTIRGDSTISQQLAAASRPPSGPSPPSDVAAAVVSCTSNLMTASNPLPQVGAAVQQDGRVKDSVTRAAQGLMTFYIQIVTALKLWCRNVVDKIWTRNIQLQGFIRRWFRDGITQGRIDQDDIEAAVILRVVGEQQRRGRNKRWRMSAQLPLRDTELLAFLVKASESSVNGMLALNVAGLTVLYYPKQDLGDMPKSVHENSDGKIYFILVTIAMYKFTVWVSSKAKAAEHNRSCLSTLSVYVIVIFSYPVFVGGFMTYCVTRAAIFEIAPVAIIMIVIMLATWAMTFSRPKILRRFFFCWGCFDRDPAAARAIEDEIVAQERNDSASSAKAAFVAQLRSEWKAAIAKDRASEARQAHAKAEQEAAAAKNRAEKALSDLQIARETVLNDEAAAGSVQLLNEAENVYVATQKAAVDAEERALETAADAHNKMEEARAADEEAKSATTYAQGEYERALAAKAISEL